MSQAIQTTTTDTEEALRFARAAKLNIIFISDIHLGHPRTTTESTLTTLELHFTVERLKDVDILFITGDFFDMLLENASSDLLAIRQYVARLLRKCVEANVVLRVLRGTGLHDWDQPIMFVEENENHQIGCDLKYIKDIYIEQNEKFGIDILYVPDEANPKAIDTWNRVEELMREKNISKVDYTLIHGLCQFHMPNIEEVQEIAHDPDKYMAITRQFVNMGHIHKPCRFDRILTNGSFSRLAHGEEHDKGYWSVKKSKPTFIINHHAPRYKTIDCHQLGADEVLAKVASYIGDDFSDCHIQLSCNKSDVATSLFRRLTDIYPFCRFSYKTSTKKSKSTIVDMKKPVMQFPKLTKENLEIEWVKRAKSSPNWRPEQEQIIQGIVHAIK